MSGIAVFIHLAGAVALLLWATRMVRTGIERAYGGVLKDKLRHAVGNRFSAAFAGFLFAVALQSATAVALIVASFSAAGYVLPAIGVATTNNSASATAVAKSVVTETESGSR